jgi:hypothetical protein
MCLIAQHMTDAGSPLSRRLHRDSAQCDKSLDKTKKYEILSRRTSQTLVQKSVPRDTAIFVVGSYLKGCVTQSFYCVLIYLYALFPQYEVQFSTFCLTRTYENTKITVFDTYCFSVLQRNDILFFY